MKTCLSRKSLFAVLVCLIWLCLTADVADAAEPNLVSWWRFDEGSGTTAYDSAGDNDGNITGATWITGQIDGALSFDGSGDYVEVLDPVDGSLDFGSGNFTISLWFKTTSKNGVLVDKSADGKWYKQGYSLVIGPLGTVNNGRIGFQVEGGYRRDTIKTVHTYNDKKWHHLTVVRTGSGSANLNIYVDGVDVPTSSVANQGAGDISNSYNLSIGAKYNAGMNRWDRFLYGRIDDVRIYNRALSAEEIEQLYLDGGGDVVEEWVARYNGSANKSDWANDISVNKFGCVYVAGISYKGLGDSDYLTIKYDQNGTELWSATYDGPASRYDQAIALAISDSDNIYVTGFAAGIGYGLWATVKYDSNGNEIWVEKYNKDIRSSPRDMAIDIQGNVYIAGSSEDKYLTIKYDPNGSQIWLKKYKPKGFPTGNSALAVTVDDKSNVYVTGVTNGAYATVKYDANGTKLWDAKYSMKDDNASASDICVDESGNVYITGTSFDRYGSYTRDVATIKYDPNGDEIWVKRYNGQSRIGGSSWDYGRNIALDKKGNVYVGGWTSDRYWEGIDYLLIKYDANGNEIWVVSYDGPARGDDILHGMELDKCGNVFVTGYSYNGHNNDYLTIKYDKNGEQIWLRRYNGPANGNDKSNSLAADLFGNIYITGGSEGDGTSVDCTTIKYAQNQNPVACIVGGDRVVEAGSNCEVRVVLDGSCSGDEDSTPGTNDDINDFDWYEVIDPCDPNGDILLGCGEIIECNLPLGEHDIILEVTDKACAFDSNEVTITVEDVTPPEFSLSVEPNVLWPVNHKMAEIRPSWVVSDNCDEQMVVSLVSITIEDDDGGSSDDIVVDSNDGSIWLRAERRGKGTGRVYTITYQAVDDSNNAAFDSAAVTVPHDQRRH